MTWVSENNLVSSISNSGGFGVIACGAMNPDQLEKEIDLTFKKTNKPFGVNLILMHPEINDLIDLCIRKKNRLCCFSWRIPKEATDLGIKKK